MSSYRTYPPQQFKGNQLEKNVQIKHDGRTETLKNYIPDPDLVSATNLALLLEKPLLVIGEPGCGKSLLAKALAYDLYKKELDKKDLSGFYREWHIKSTSKAKEGLYEFDNLHRLRDATLPTGKADISNIDKYIHFGPMGEAFRLSVAPNKRVVLLIDEIDKADIDFPNDLLNELDKMEFDIQEKKIEESAAAGTKAKGSIPVKVKAAYRPIVIITSNSEKELPDAFLRRCIFHYIRPLEEEKLKQIVYGRYYNGEREDGLVQKAISLFVKLRATIRDELLSIGKNISTSEFIDWFEALKYYDDLKRGKGEEAAEVRSMIKELDKLDKNDLRQIPFYNILMKNVNSVIRFSEQKSKQP